MFCKKPPKRPPEKESIFKIQYPKSIFIPDLPFLKTIYDFKGKLPEIFILHTTGGWGSQSARDFISDFNRRVLCTLFMDESGQVYQQYDLCRGGRHVGASKFENRGNVSSFAGGIELACSGKLIKKEDGFYTWFNQKIDNQKWRRVTKDQGYNHDGFFHCLTPAQEKELAVFCSWLKRNGVKHILEHSDVAPNRKTDVGGSLSQPLQKWLKNNVK